MLPDDSRSGADEGDAKMRSVGSYGKYLFAGAAALTALASLDTADASKFQILHKFIAGSDGANPVAGLIADSSGNLYGTTEAGGSGNCLGGCGTVFKVAPDGTETVLYAFTHGSDGGYPSGGLIEDSAGNLYGMAGGGSNGAGTIFKLASDGTLTVLYAFAGGSDGSDPRAGLIKDKGGNFYGTTYGGGSYNAGTVFRLAPDGTETVLHSFGDANDGCLPVAGVIRDKAGNLYGTTEGTSTSQRDCASEYGTVFRIASDGTESVLYSFGRGIDGGAPNAGLIMDSAGDLYGTTGEGGDTNCNPPIGCGTVFQLAPDGTKTVLYAFTGYDGRGPSGGLVKDKAGNLYGTTVNGGTQMCRCGTAFRLAPDGTEIVLYNFSGYGGGSGPEGGLIKSGSNLYGTTIQGGDTNCAKPLGCGIVFKLKK